MKKTLAFILVCALLVSAFALNAFAANVVGTHGQNGTSSEDGVVDFNEGSLKNNTGSVTVKVDAVVHKYAVDLDYAIPAYELPTITWNVNTLMYDLSAVDAAKDINNDVVMVLTNYSDKTVNTKIDVVDSYTADGIEFEWNTPTGNITAPVASGYTASATIDAVKALTTGSIGAAQTVTYILDVSCADVVETVLYFESQSAVGTTTIATYTVTVAK